MAAVDLVLRLRRVVVALRQPRFHFVSVARDVGTEQENAADAHGGKPEQHFQRRHSYHGVQHRLPVGRIVRGFGNWPAEDYMVHQHFRRPRQDGELHHVGGQLQTELAKVAPEEEANVGGAAQKYAEGIALANLRLGVDAARPFVQRTVVAGSGAAHVGSVYSGLSHRACPFLFALVALLAPIRRLLP